MAWGCGGATGWEKSGPASVDADVVARLTADLGPDGVAAVCQVFLADARERVRAAGAACRSADARGAARSAHRLKSASGFLGANGVSTLCREIERLAGEDRLADVAVRVDQLAEEVERASTELVAVLERVVHRSGGVDSGPAAAAT